jgi:uncharacterized SAM-binding protein YcdF (DUF218 family)
MAVPENVAPGDAIVVLGSSVRPDGTLDEASLRRTIRGVVLARQGLAPLLALSGVTLGPGLSEDIIRSTLAKALGIGADSLLLVAGVRTTREEVHALSPVLRMRNVHRLLLVTDPFHMDRARRLFNGAGFEVLAAPSDEVSMHVTAPGDRWSLTRQILEESMARGYYRAARYL